MAAIGGGCRDIARDVLAADHVENHIDTAALRDLTHGADEILGVIVDGTLGTQCQAGRALFGSAPP